MNRLEAELQRLYRPGDGVGPRALVLELARPAHWETLARVWQGVQADLQLPAPAIAVSGSEGYQLWFSFAEAVPAQRALDFARLLQQRYWSDVASDRIAAKPWAPGERVPPVQAGPGRWAAFVAPDLAALFADEPWLDLAPSPQAQADLLARLQSMAPADVERALASLAPPVRAGAVAKPVAGASHQDARSFLLEVMNDPAVEMKLRIEAAKALLHP